MDRRAFVSALCSGSFSVTAGAAGFGFLTTPESREVRLAPNVDALRRTNPVDNQWVFVQGYHEPFDGGGGLFVWRTGETDDPDGGLVFTSLLGEHRPGQDNAGRWYRFVDQPFLNVKWWGARGTTEHDDASAIQAAVNAARLQKESWAGIGGEVFIPPGKYLIKGTIRIPSSVSVRGAGMSPTRLIAGLQDGAMLQIEPNTGFQTIQKLSLRSGSPRPNLTGIELTGHGRAGEGAGNRNIQISDVYVWGIGRGVHGKQCWMTRLANVRVKKADVGISFESGYTTLLFDNCFVDGCTVGFRMRGVDTATFNACAVDKARCHAVWLEGGSYVFNTFQSEANRYTETNSSIFRVDGPCTVQCNGCVTYAIGIEDTRENADAEQDRLYLLDCRANDGAVHVNVAGGRQEKTISQLGEVRRLRFESDRADYTAQSSVHITQSLLDKEEQIDVSTPPGSSPRISTPQNFRSSRSQEDTCESESYRIRGTIEDARRLLDVDEASSDDVARVVATLIDHLQRRGIID